MCRIIIQVFTVRVGYMCYSVVFPCRYRHISREHIARRAFRLMLFQVLPEAFMVKAKLCRDLCRGESALFQPCDGFGVFGEAVSGLDFRTDDQSAGLPSS